MLTILQLPYIANQGRGAMKKKALYNFILILANLSFVDNFSGSYPHIYVNSIPKCGTHLLTQCVKLLTNRPLWELPTGQMVADNSLPYPKNNEFFATHVVYSQAAVQTFNKRNFKTLFIYRDPRDQVVSWVYFIYEGGFKKRRLDNPLRKLPFSQLLTTCIKDVKNEYKKYLPWMKEKNCCTIRFEDLIGPQGGGSLERQIAAIKKIAEHLEVPLNDSKLKYCVNNLFGSTITFRSGKIGGWKTHFKSYHKDIFNASTGDLLKQLGYVKNDKW